MKQFSKPLFIIVVIAQICVLGYMIQKRVSLLRHGKKIVLACEPRDPRSLFSGDYVILNYKISRLDKNIFTQDLYNKFDKNDTIYVGLIKDENSQYWTAKEVSKDLEELKKKYNVVIRGRLENRYSRRIRYGVEEYFVPQKEGLIIEKQLANVSVEVAVADDGESAISRLFIENKEVVFY